MEQEQQTKTERKEYKDRVFPTFSHFPLEKWCEYEKEVEDRWAGCRWAKAWHDHEIAKSVSKEEALWNAILEIKTELEKLKQVPVKQEPEQPKVPSTIGKKKGDT